MKRKLIFQEISKMDMLKLYNKNNFASIILYAYMHIQIEFCWM